jgi:hypothetical protein
VTGHVFAVAFIAAPAAAIISSALTWWTFVPALKRSVAFWQGEYDITDAILTDIETKRSAAVSAGNRTRSAKRKAQK